ncbi:TPA: hypothetical protein ACGUP1_002186 [Vibrio vulnificus]|nr:hypothetical protein [Vibrio vulnificus]HDY7436654.1 hypothetical protein [Vibrio vulnificus]
MNSKDKIIDALFELYEEEIDVQISKEQEEAFKDGVPEALQDEAWSMLQNVYEKLNAEAEETSTVIHAPFGQKKTPKAPVEFLESFELLAAAADDQSPWFAQRISANGDYIIEISPFDDNQDEAGIVITAAPGKEEKLQTWLNAYKGQTIPVSLSWDNVTIFEADLYVDLTDARAEGEGKIIRADRQVSGSRLSFKINKAEE